MQRFRGVLELVVPCTIPALVGLAGCSDECHDVGAHWCDGDLVRECYALGGGGHGPSSNVIKSEDCSERGLVCRNDTGKARCAYAAPLCAQRQGSETLCIGSEVGECEAEAEHPVRAEWCEGATPYCVESGTHAGCAPFAERCEQSEPDRCHEGQVASCEDQHWHLSSQHCFGACDPGDVMRCDLSFDYRGDPIHSVQRCVGRPGLWLFVGESCASGCACEAPQRCACN